MNAIELRIEELVLNGFPARDAHAIALAAERELARLLGERSLSESLLRGAAPAHVDGGSFVIASGSGPAAIGAQIAASVYRGIDR